MTTPIRLTTPVKHTWLILMIGILSCLTGCDRTTVATAIEVAYEKYCLTTDWPDELLRPFVDEEFVITAHTHSHCERYYAHCVAYTVEPKALRDLAQSGPWQWQPLPLPDAIENGMGTKSRTWLGATSCIVDNNDTLMHKVDQASRGEIPGYYRFYRYSVLAFYLPDTRTLVVTSTEH